MPYNKKNVKLYRTKSPMEKFIGKDIRLWNFAPPWPKSYRSNIDPDELSDMVSLAYSVSNPNAHMVLWMPARELYRTHFDPVSMCKPWKPKATIFSGSSTMSVGYVYSHTYPRVDWYYKHIIDEYRKCGPSSPRAVRFILEHLGEIKECVVGDPFAHESATLPTWTRRFGMKYIGCTPSKKSYKSIKSILSQIELPGTQLEML